MKQLVFKITFFTIFTFGHGLYIVFNQNNVITVNYGIPANKQLGQGGFYIGSSLLF
ncbi:MAG: hypothetical protein LC658_05885 [Bacteroidales bacterium]|nr:hypothetical protein [Bacteroidales bacterium]